MKKIIALICCLVMIFAAVAACTQPSDNPATTKKPLGTVPGSGADAQTTDIPATEIGLDLPEDLNYGGMTINTCYREDKGDMFIGDNESGDVVVAAIYNSNSKVDEMLGIKRNYIPIRDSILTRLVTKTIMNGEGLYDYVCVDQYYGTQYCVEGLYKDLSPYKFLDYSKPWYYDKFMDNLSIGEGNIFYVAGDVYPIIMSWTSCVYWNKTVYADVISTDMLSLYNLVDKGEWTLDQFGAMARKAWEDFDGDGLLSENDRVGFLNSVHGSEEFTLNAGLKITKKSSDGFYDIVIDTEKNSDIVEKVRDIFYNGNGGIITNDTELNTAKFTNDTSLFYCSFFLSAFQEGLRGMSSEYGIVPYPKYDETQDDYISTVHNSAFVVGVPTDIGEDKMEAITACIEAQGYQNYKDVMPKFYETALKVKYVGDDENSEYAVRMIDIIKDSVYVDFAYIYSAAINDLGRIMHTAFENNASLSRTYAEKQSAIEATLQALFDSFEKSTTE